MNPKMTFTEFIDVVIKVGTTKITKIRQIKNKPEYEPATDFYRSLRLYLIEYHQKMLYDDKKKTAIDLTQDKKKYEHFNILLNGYWQYLGKKNLNGSIQLLIKYLFKQLKYLSILNWV